MKILVVDDDRMMVRTLGEILRMQGWETREVHDGPAAVEAVKQERFDAVLMDYKMPGMSGVSAFRAMKGARPDVKVVLMTAFAAEDILEAAEREGVLRTLSKPVDIRALLAFLAGVLSTKGPVLIVDNDAAFLHTMAEVLQLRGFETLVARDLAEARRLIQSRRPAAIMLHMHLGTATPGSAVAAVHGAEPDAPLILYSGQPEAERAINGDVPREWVHSYLQKPIAVDTIAGVLSEVVES